MGLALIGIIILILPTDGSANPGESLHLNQSPYSTYIQWGNYGSGPGEFDDIKDIEVGPDGTIYIADSGNNRDEDSISLYRKKTSFYPNLSQPLQWQKNTSYVQYSSALTWYVPTEVIRSPSIRYTTSVIRDSDGLLYATASENDGVLITDPLGHVQSSINNGISKAELQKEKDCMCAGSNRTSPILNMTYDPIEIILEPTGNLSILDTKGISRYSNKGLFLSGFLFPPANKNFFMILPDLLWHPMDYIMSLTVIITGFSYIVRME